MNSTVEKFTQKLEELKKRLKAISTSQNVLSKLNALEDYFSQIQDYLNAINTSFSDHITESEDYSTNINTLQTQLEEIQQQIQTLPDFNELNLTQMQTDISTLQNDLSTLKGTSNSSLQTLEEQLSALNADISTITAQISTLQSNNSSLATDISTLKSTTQNHSTTLTNLTSTQNTLTNTVNNINNRLTSAESELSAITGGVDLTELNDKVIKLELLSGPIYLHKEINNLSSVKSTSQSYWHSRRIHFSSIPFTILGGSVTVKLKYISAATQSITMDLFISSIIHKTITILPTETEIEYTFPVSYETKNYDNCLYVRFMTSDEIVVESINVNLYGPNIKLTPYDNDLSVYCFNGYIYITRHYDNYIRYQKFAVGETIDLNKLSNIYYLSSDAGSYNRLYFIPYVYGVKNEEDSKTYLSKTTDVLYAEKTDEYIRLIKLEDDGVEIDLSIKNLRGQPAAEISTGVTSIMYRMIVDKDIIYHRELIYAYTGYQLSPDYGVFIDVVGEKRNFTTTESQSEKINNICYIAKKTDGYFYIFKGITLNNPISLKLIKGNKATLFRKQDGSLNAYIVVNNTTYKYNITFTTSEDKTTINSELVATIANCDCVYETLNNQIIKHNIKASGNEWVVDTLEY